MLLGGVLKKIFFFYHLYFILSSQLGILLFLPSSVIQRMSSDVYTHFKHLFSTYEYLQWWRERLQRLWSRIHQLERDRGQVGR